MCYLVRYNAWVCYEKLGHIAYKYCIVTVLYDLEPYLKEAIGID